jgi:formamidopyrimidine-DNA glycosylase
MPELPEVEIVVRLIGEAVEGAVVESVVPVGVSTLKTFDPPTEALNGRRITGLRRRGKRVIVDVEDELHVLLHLMSAGRLQLYDRRGSAKDRTSRFLIRLEDGRELRLREFGTRQSSWVKVLTSKGLESEPSLVRLGPEAWPEPPPFRPLLNEPRPLHSILRDQEVVAGIGRSWVDEILHQARLSPFKKGSDLNEEEAEALRGATIERLGFAIDHYTRVLRLPIPDKLPMPLKVHGRRGKPCPRCGEPLQAVHFEDHDMVYCPACQTAGRLLKDRRLSRLLK